MGKWIVTALSITSILVWLAVIWVFLGQENTVPTHNHALSQREVLAKSNHPIVSYNSTKATEEVKDVVVETAQTAGNSNKQETIKEIAKNSPVSIDQLLDALNISYEN